MFNPWNSVCSAGFALLSVAQVGCSFVALQVFAQSVVGLVSPVCLMIEARKASQFCLPRKHGSALPE